MTRIFKLKIIYIYMLFGKILYPVTYLVLGSNVFKEISCLWSIDRGHTGISRPTRFTMESGLFRSGRSYWGKSDCREGKIRARWLLVMCREYRDTFCNRQVCFLVLVCNGDCVGRSIAETRNTR